MPRGRSNSGAQHEPPPKDLGELRELAQTSASQDWSPGYSLVAWGRLVRQLMSEGRVYHAEGDVDLAFVRHGTVFHLCRDIIPSSHPDWSTCPPSLRDSFARNADASARELDDLRKIVQSRSDAYVASHPRVAPVAKGSSPALTLRNTVLPAATSMSSTPDSDILLKKLAATQKESKKGLFKRAFGGGKKRAGSSSPSMGTLAEPGTGNTTDEERESERQWSTPEPGRHDLPLGDGRGAGVRRRAATNDRLQPQPMPAPQAYQPNRLPRKAHQQPQTQLSLPGEDDSDDDLPGIEYSGASSYSREQPYSSFFPNGTRPPPADSATLTPAYPSAPSSSVSGSVHSAYSTHSAPGNYYNPQQSRTSPSFAPPPPSAPQSWSPLNHLASPPNPPSALLRSPSRLTISHQQQQGYSPNPRSLRGPSSHLQSRSSGYIDQQRYASYLPPPQPPQAPNLPPPAGCPSASRQAALPYPPQPPQPPSSYPRPIPSAPSFPPSAPPAACPSELTRRSSSVGALPVGLLGGRGSANARRGLDGMGDLKGVLEEEDFMGITEGGQPLRNLILPSTLVDHFVALASSNTDNGVETCGFLLGSLSHNTFTVSHLLIPKQEGTPDTCMTTDEEGVFKFQDDRDLMTLGWIHTHPTQTCFMSSLDLHTHASYQLTLAEAIAVVCAPSHDPSFGIFRMTDPPGLETIIKCKQSSLFHPHDDLPIYTDVDHSWGHCRMRNLQFDTADLRRS